jgi:hypothetical protein
MKKSVFNFKIHYKDGTEIDLHKDKNIWVSSFRILSLSPEHMTETVEGCHGAIHLGTSLKEREITARFMIEGYDPIDFDLFRDELFRLFNPLEKLYIIRDLQPGKRLEVSVSSEFDIDYLTLEDGEFEVDFVIHSVFLESIVTTQDLFTFDNDFLQFGQGLILDDLIYAHTDTIFSIYNAGDVTVDPRNLPLLITYTGASTNLSIKNTTTGDEWTHTGTSNPSDIIRLDGIRSTKNSLSIFRDTNRKLISLAPGWNDFELTGATSPFEISFDFRFYYF